MKTPRLDALAAELAPVVFRMLGKGDAYGAWRVVLSVADEANAAHHADLHAAVDTNPTGILRIIEPAAVAS